MNKIEYYAKCMRDGTYLLRQWVISVFSLNEKLPLISEATYQNQLVRDSADEEGVFFANLDGDKFVPVRIDNVTIKGPLYHALEPVTFTSDLLPMDVPEEETTYGIVLQNMYLLYTPFGNKFPFVNGEIKSSFGNTIARILTDNVGPGEEEDPSKVYVREYLMLCEACEALASFDKLFIYTGSNKLLTVDPSVIKLRDELLEKHKHELGDVRVQASIEQQLVAADKASFKGDPAERFLVSGKAFNPTRKKQLILIGASAGLGGEASDADAYVPKSLRDGWRVEDIPKHANEARAGSFFRGMETAAGGTDVAMYTRMMQNAKVVDQFCGTKVGLPTVVHERDTAKYLGQYLVGSKGPIHITESNISSFIGKSVMVHSPAYCKSEGDTYCKYCVGDSWSVLRNGLNNALSNIGDVFMNAKMKKMHGAQLKLTTFHFIDHIN